MPFLPGVDYKLPQWSPGQRQVGLSAGPAILFRLFPDQFAGFVWLGS